ncbi:hypothetical protein ON010_g18708 [Phytophthora cinnamomi]|nr:hypothetical protein ON010_g18708 [Phytophthora cinnamomi]
MSVAVLAYDESKLWAAKKTPIDSEIAISTVHMAVQKTIAPVANTRVSSSKERAEYGGGREGDRRVPSRASKGTGRTADAAKNQNPAFEQEWKMWGLQGESRLSGSLETTVRALPETYEQEKQGAETYPQQANSSEKQG